jgi:hypothetical protein
MNIKKTYNKTSLTYRNLKTNDINMDYVDIDIT